MPRGPSIKPEVESLCKIAWQAKRPSILNKTMTIQKVYDDELPKFLTNVKKEDWPGLSWFTKRINDPKKGWEITAQNQPMAPDPIVQGWDPKWWKTPRSIYVLTTLYDQAKIALHRTRNSEEFVKALDDGEEDYLVTEFNGLTDRICKWAVKLSEFFDLTVIQECYLLILIANQFAYEERKQSEYPDGNELLNVVDNRIPFIWGRNQLNGWQRHRMKGIKDPDIDKPYYLWQATSEALQQMVALVISFRQVLLKPEADPESKTIYISAVVD